MRVRIVPYAELRHHLLPNSGESLWLELFERAKVGDALRLLGIERRDQLIVGVDGEYATVDTPLHDGAEVVLVTPMEGG